MNCIKVSQNVPDVTRKFANEIVKPCELSELCKLTTCIRKQISLRASSVIRVTVLLKYGRFKFKPGM